MTEKEAFIIRPGILELMAGIALSGVEGASGVGVRSDHPEDVRKRKNLSKGIKSQVEEGVITLDLDINVDYGKNIHAVAGAIQREVKNAVESMTGWKVSAVNINVVGVNAL